MTIADPFAVRERLEMLVAWLAAERATTAAVAHLRSLLDEVRMATDRRDFSRVAELNSEVHLHVVAISGNQWLSSIANSLYTQVHGIFRIGPDHRAPHSWVEHLRLVDAIETGDLDEAELTARSHVDAASEAALVRAPNHG